MLRVGATTEFERDYMAKFKVIAQEHGIFVEYEADRAARDVGLHLTKSTKDGKRVMNSIVWFQMKGLMTKTLSAKQFDKDAVVKLSLEVKHLQHWFLDDVPTHLLVYIESVDKFLVMNLRDYVASTWGSRILELDQETATVSVPMSSVLDEQAFSILLRTAAEAQWAKAIKLTADDAGFIHRDAGPILTIASGEDRGVVFGAYWREWQSKLRQELHLLERPDGFAGAPDDGWETFHQHWQLGAIDPESKFPYLDFFALEDTDNDLAAWSDEESYDGAPVHELSNGDKVAGEEAGGEYIEFWFGVKLNDYGRKLVNDMNRLIKLGLLEQPSTEDDKSFVSLAPWHHRAV